MTSAQSPVPGLQALLLAEHAPMPSGAGSRAGGNHLCRAGGDRNGVGLTLVFALET